MALPVRSGPSIGAHQICSALMMVDLQDRATNVGWVELDATAVRLHSLEDDSDTTFGDPLPCGFQIIAVKDRHIGPTPRPSFKKPASGSAIPGWRHDLQEQSVEGEQGIREPEHADLRIPVAGRSIKKPADRRNRLFQVIRHEADLSQTSVFNAHIHLQPMHCAVAAN